MKALYAKRVQGKTDPKTREREGRLAISGNRNAQGPASILTNDEYTYKFADAVPGDMLAYKNPDSRSKSFENENTIYLYDDDEGMRWLYAHPWGILPEG